MPDGANKSTVAGEGREPENGAERQSLTEQATATLRDRILDLTLKPGMRLDEKLLMDQFEFGRTPLREAINRLVTEGLVESRGARGFAIAPMDLQSAIELFDAYTLSERTVGSMLRFDYPNLLEALDQVEQDFESLNRESELLRVTKLNAEFHRLLAEATGNVHIREFSVRLHNLARRLSWFIYQKEFAAAEDKHVVFSAPRTDHREIIAAIENHDRAGLVELLTRHAELFRRRLSRLIDGARDLRIELGPVGD